MIKDRKKRIIYSFLLNIVVLLIALFVFKPFFEEIDDTHIAMISEGAYGYREWHILISNVVLGKLYVLLSTIAPSIRWHSILQYVFIFLAYTVATYAISKHKNGILISATAILTTFYEMYVSLQYTKTGTFICSVGILLGLEAIRELYEQSKVDAILYLLSCYVFVLYGSILRYDTFFIACVPVAFYGVYELIKTKQLKKYILVFVPMVMVVFLFMFANNYIATSDEKWDEYSDYSKVRVELTDRRYDALDYNAHGEELRNLGVSENDAFVILTYQYGDDEVFSTERWREILDTIPVTKITDRTFRNWYGNVRDEFSKLQVALYLLIVYVVIVLVVCIRKKESLRMYTVILMGILCTSALFYFHYSGRWSHRLVASLTLAAILTISFILCYESEDTSENQAEYKWDVGSIMTTGLYLVIAISVILNIAMYIKSSRGYKEYCQNQAETIAILDSVKKDALENQDSPLYIADTFMFQNVWKYEVFKPSTVGELKNFVTCASWFVNSPITKSITESYGYSNPYEALLNGKDDVVLLDNNMREYKAKFLLEHYGAVLDK